MQIIDLAGTQDFTIEVGNGQETSLLTHHTPGINSVTEMYSTTPYAFLGPGNGVVGVYVVNELTTPNSATNNDIEINVFVSAGSDFEVFVPDAHIQNFVFKPQSGVESFQPQSGSEGHIPDSQNTPEPSAPVQEQVTSLGPGLTDGELINRVYTGECISSFRMLLKRYNLHSCMGTQSNDRSILSGRRPMFPYLRGNVTNAIDDSAVGAYNYCNTVLLHWVTYAFSGWRGSIRWKILPRGMDNGVRGPVYYVQRHSLGGPEFSRNVFPMPDYVNENSTSFSAVTSNSFFPESTKPLSGMMGSHYAHGLRTPACEFEVPFYSPFRFSPGKAQALTGPLALWTEGFDYRIFTEAKSPFVYDLHCAAGEDFQTYFFTGLPRMYFESSPPSVF